MPSADVVQPRKWRNKKVLFDNKQYSVISGLYAGGSHRVLGERWNGGDADLGFPNVAGNPVWHVVPEFLAIQVLIGLLDELAANPTKQSGEHTKNILHELQIQQAHRCN